MTIIVENLRTSYDWIARIEDDDETPQGHGSTPWYALRQLADTLQEQAEAHVVNSAIESARERQTGQREDYGRRD